MASTFSISGISSGLDWKTMISQLVELERKPITLLENRQTTLTDKKSAWNELNTKLLSLKTAAGSLSSLDDFDVFKPSAAITGTSSDIDDILNFAVGSNASEGSYTITVNKLATAEKRKSNEFSSLNEALNISGDLTINGHAVTIEATDSLSNIQKKINDLNFGDDPIDVTASIVSISSTKYRLTLTSQTTGAAGMTVIDGAGLGLDDANTAENRIVDGQDAEIVIDGDKGFTITRSTNTITDVINGVTLNLVGADPDATITLNVKRNHDGIKGKIQDFVESYNEVMSYITSQNTVSEDGKTTGALFADSSLQTIKSSLRNVILSGVSGLDSTLDHLSLIGINLDKAGQLSIDDDKLDGYLKSNFEDIVNLFAAHGSSTSSNLTYVASGIDVAGGDYEVTVTQAATKANTVGSGFSGTLSENITLTLTNSRGTAQNILLSTGSDITAIVDAINAADTLGITAQDIGGQLSLTSDYYGTPGNFTVSVSGGNLGLAEVTQGVDVVGTIRKQGSTEVMTMTGKGQVLTGDDGQDVEGLVIRYTGSSSGTFDFSFTEGVAEKLDRALYSMTDSIDGYVANKQESIQRQIDNIDENIEKMEVRLSKYEETLIAKYTAMEKLLNTLMSQQNWLTSQINSLSGS
ncbi:MAG TPA: flagellar filament capping protein FliD [Deltaproteobacteria bacterium]|nr:flagellar filament capping protein FliD [Deltaproteobacteria bacterium]